MRIALALLSLFLLISGCSRVGSNAGNPAANVSNTTAGNPAKPLEIKDGEYPGKGKVIKTDTTIGSVELNHGDVPGLMPAMQMEFYVSDKALLKGIQTGDEVDFTIEYKGGTETITRLAKAK